MPCYHPLSGYKKPGGGITFKRPESTGQLMQVPCGQCIGCRLERSRQWAIRCVHEAQMNDQDEGGLGSTFITLTYEVEPDDLSLNWRHFSRFMKRLRKKYEPRKIRYYHCGEYGEDQDDLALGIESLGRPHYHALLFNHTFSDRELFNTREGIPLYTSETLTALWAGDKKHSGGHCTIGEVNFQTAAYVARYVMKKISGDQAKDHYVKADKKTGELLAVAPEYTTMSRNPGIGHSWYEKFASDLFPDDFAILNGKKMKVPEYYLQQLKTELPHLHQDLKTERTRKFEKRADDNTPERLLVKEKCTEARLSHLQRNL